MVSIVTDVTDRKAAEDHIQFLMHEISHRSKNLLMVIQSIARRTARTAGSMEEFERRFERRLQGLAASHDVLVSENWQGAPLADLVRQQLVPFAEIQEFAHRTCRTRRGRDGGSSAGARPCDP